MAEYVDLLIAPEHRLSVMRELDEWNKQHGTNRVWVIGDDNGRVMVGDVPTDALESLTKRGIQYEPRPRDPHRPLPVPVPL